MPASPADSALYRSPFGDDATAQLFTDRAKVRAVLLVLGRLAVVQGELRLIPQAAAAFRHRASVAVRFAAWMAGLTASLGKIGADLILLTPDRDCHGFGRRCRCFVHHAAKAKPGGAVGSGCAGVADRRAFGDDAARGAAQPAPRRGGVVHDG